MTTRTETAASLVVSEVFGPTVQGEGPSLGRRAGFVRLGACNLSCSWCDTAYTWDGRRFDLRAELTRRDVTGIADELLDMGVPLAVITGGEPLLQQHHAGFTGLLSLLRGHEVEIETNGTLVPAPPLLDGAARFNVGLKLANSGDPAHRRIRPDAIAVFRSLAAAGRACFKTVCRGAGDVTELARLAESFDLDPATVWVMPEGETTTRTVAHLRDITAPALERGFNITPRLHVLIWGSERGH